MPLSSDPGASPGEPPDVETASEAYARRFSGAVGAWFLEVQTQATLELLEGLSGGSALDVGGGHGQLVPPLLAKGFAVTVLGSQEAPPDPLRSFLEKGQIRFLSGSLARFPFPDRSFDIVLSYRLLPHTPAWRGLIIELCRVARRAVLVDDPTVRSVNAASGVFFSVKRGIETDARPFRVFHDREIHEAFEHAGFEGKEKRGEFVLPMALHRAIGRARLSRGLEGALSGLGLRRLLGSPVILRAEPA
jgi:SAM-dependent methyltransferase